MSELSKEEMDYIEKREAALAERSRQKIAQKQHVQFRLEPEKILRLFDVANAKQMPISALLRQWVSERLEQEGSGQGKFVPTGTVVYNSGPLYGSMPASTSGPKVEFVTFNAAGERIIDADIVVKVISEELQSSMIQTTRMVSLMNEISAQFGCKTHPAPAPGAIPGAHSPILHPPSPWESVVRRQDELSGT